MTEFDEILSKALKAARYYYPRLSREIYVFPKPTTPTEAAEPAASTTRKMLPRLHGMAGEVIGKRRGSDRGAITIGQLRSRIFRDDSILIPREIILAMAVYNCLEIFVGANDVWLGKMGDDLVPL